TPVQAEENAAQGVLTALMIRYLKEASPWLRFIGIMGYIGAIFLIVSGVIMSIALLITGQNFGSSWGPLSALMGVIYVTLGVLAFFPARFTHKFGAKLRNYLLSGAERDLEEAFKNNRSLWRFSGILLIVYLAILPVALIMGVVTAVSSLF
ncbi:MAG: hypothetical protein LBU19_02175, partial [Treponema sp.]|nr:hypothetical protein [Treponema sp.]